MLTNLAECTTMRRTKCFLNVLDHGSLLVKGSPGDDEGLGSTELCDNI